MLRTCILKMEGIVSGSVSRLFRRLDSHGADQANTAPISTKIAAKRLYTIISLLPGGNCDISIFRPDLVHFRPGRLYGRKRKTSHFSRFSQITCQQSVCSVLLFCFIESTFLCGHFAAKIIKIHSRSSENGPFEV